MVLDQAILGLIFESLIFLGISFGCSYFCAAIHLLSMDRKLPVSEFKDRQKSVMFLSMSLFSFGYVAIKYVNAVDADQFLADAPAIGFFGLLGVGFGKFYVNFHEKVREHKERYELKRAKKEAEKPKKKAKADNHSDDEILKKDPLDEPVNFSKMRKSSKAS